MLSVGAVENRSVDASTAHKDLPSEVPKMELRVFGVPLG